MRDLNVSSVFVLPRSWREGRRRVWDKERMCTLCAGPGADAAGAAPTKAAAAWSLVCGRSDPVSEKESLSVRSGS